MTSSRSVAPISIIVDIDGIAQKVSGTKYVANAVVADVSFGDCLLCPCFTPFAFFISDIRYNEHGQYGSCGFIKGAKVATNCGIENFQL
jgi:hypothetical protein